MKKRNLASRIMTSGLAAALALGMSVAPVMAATIDDNATEDQTFSKLNDAITKNVKYANGVTVPASQEFKFTFTQDTSTEGLVHDTASIPEVTITSDSKTAVTTDSTKMTGTTTAFTQKGTISLANLTKAGTYRYTVAESNLGSNAFADGYGWTKDSKTYTMTVVVQADGTKAYSIWDGSEKIDDLSKFAFTNTYTKRGGNDITTDEDSDNKSDSLIIEKATSGTNIPSGKDYTFTLSFTKSATAENLPASFSANKVTPAANKEGNPTIESQTVTLTDGSATVTLKAGEKLVFDDIPAGTYYKIAEAADSDATASLAITENGTARANAIQGEKGQGVNNNDAPALIGEGANKATVTNSYSTITLTGITSQYGGLIAIVVIAVAGGAILVMRRRRFAE